MRSPTIRIMWVTLFVMLELVLALGLTEFHANVEEQKGFDIWIRGTWEQSCTELLSKRGAWPYAANAACRSTPPTLETMDRLLQD